MAKFSGQWGLAKWGLARWAFPPDSSATGGATITGQGVMTANGQVTVFGAVTLLGQGVFTTGPIAVFTGQGVMTAAGVVLEFGSGNLTGQGIFALTVTCSRDLVLTSIQMPRSTVAVVMPVAFITKVNMPTETPNCGPVSTTIPATGALDTFVEISSDPVND